MKINLERLAALPKEQREDAEARIKRLTAYCASPAGRLKLREDAVNRDWRRFKTSLDAYMELKAS